MSGDTLGPVQLIVAGFDEDAEPRGAVLAELEGLAEHDMVRLIDVLLVRKGDDGRIAVLQAGERSGSVVALLTGLHDDEAAIGADVAPAEEADPDADVVDVWYAADAIPPGRTAALALIEHRWAIGLRAALQGPGRALLAEAWVHPLDLDAVGLGG